MRWERIVSGLRGLLGWRAVHLLQALSITISPSIGEGLGQKEGKDNRRKALEIERGGCRVYLHLGDGFTVK